LKTITNIYWATPRAMNVPAVSAMNSKVLRRAMLSHLGHIFGTKKFENANQDIIVLAKHSMKPLAHLDPTPPTKDPLDALNAHPVPLPTRLVPKLVKIVTLIPTNPNPMRRNAFQCKKGSTNPVPQHK
jgi:hypothetical protein